MMSIIHSSASYTDADVWETQTLLVTELLSQCVWAHHHDNHMGGPITGAFYIINCTLLTIKPGSAYGYRPNMAR